METATPRPKIRVLFLCTGNACRSQMAEGWARRLKGEVLEPCSAGVQPSWLDPRAVQVMAEAGVDISQQRAKHVSEFEGREFDLVVTLCDDARERCPVFPGRARVIHRSFEDPPYLARNARTEDEALAHYRRVRDQLRGFIEELSAAAPPSE